MLGLRTAAYIAKNVGNKRLYSTRQRDFREVSIKVPWGRIAGKWWEPYDERPILTIHGWQDNCKSFDRLIPLLNKSVGFLTIDLPGHGLSSRLPKGMNYHFTVYLITVRSIVQFFDWPKCSLLGHSLGGVLCYTYSMLYPAEVDMLMTIEGSKPESSRRLNVKMAEIVDAFLKYDSFIDSPGEPPSYTYEEMTKMIAAPNNNSISLEYTSMMMERNIAPSKVHPGKYYFTRDPRTKTRNLLPFSQDDLIRFAQQMTMPILFAKAEDASYWEPKENYFQVLDVIKRVSADCEFHIVPGSHHVHLNQPENVSDLILSFIRRHNIEDRSKGGFRDDIFAEEKTNEKERKVMK